MSIQVKTVRSNSKYVVYTHGEWKSKLTIQLSEIPVYEIDKNGSPIHIEPADGYIFVLPRDYLTRHKNEIVPVIESEGISRIRIISIVNTPECQIGEGFSDYMTGVFPDQGKPEFLAMLVENALFALRQTQECAVLENKLAGVYNDMRSLTKIGKALLTERNFDDLIGLILNETRKMVDADGGSIYVVEPPEKKGARPTKLRFKKSALNLDADEFVLGIDNKSIAGYVALTGEPLFIDDVYNLHESSEFHFNPEFDKIHNYHTKSMMLIPMKNHREDVIGVIQLINKMRPGLQKLTLEDMRGDGVISFTDRCFEITGAIAGQAAMAIENYNLINEIRKLFEGFVKASVTAIEQRDPTTSGHSFRVAEYTEGLARSVNTVRDGELSLVSFTKDQLRELRYASLLHDFGKVGVREKVLVKGKKLYDHELENIRWRFHYLRKSAENAALRRKYDLARAGEKTQLELADMHLREELESINKMEKAILNANEPTVLEEGDFNVLEQITDRMLHLEQGKQTPLLSKHEFLSLSIKKGTLDAAERAEIESHVSHTYQFLNQIPWTKDLENVPDIAHFHHEKLDGSGYPMGIPAEKIPLQTRMMTIADIFDALTAWDRPYKKALPAEKALDILWDEVKHQKVDGRLLKVFTETEHYKTVLTRI